MGFQYVNIKFVFENEEDSASVNFFIVDCDEKKRVSIRIWNDGRCQNVLVGNDRRKRVSEQSTVF